MHPKCGTQIKRSFLTGVINMYVARNLIIAVSVSEN
jgi:hypothetical protein